jgi:tetratricopeptide (TPR) repeat protein
VGYALTASSSHRVAGETITGENVGQSSIAQLLQEANHAEVQGNSLAELKDTRAILAKDPTQPEALTLEGWVLAQTQQPKLLAQGIGFLKLAEEIDPGLAQAHAYRGIALLSEGDNRAAIPELEWYLDHQPDPKVAPKFRTALAKAQAAAARGTASGG